MFFANLSALEFIGLFAAAAAALAALYLLVRTRRRYTVATLRFWPQAARQADQRRRRRIDQPWSFILQLLALAALIGSIAQPRFGSRDTAGLDHVLLLDTSAWTSATSVGDETRRQALAWLRRVPASDRVMVVRADSLPTPVTRFESSRATLEAAIRSARPSSSALDLKPAFQLATQSLRLEARHAGEIVYVGPARVASTEGFEPPENLRVIETAAPPANLGITRLLVRQAASGDASFNAAATVRNYGTAPRTVPFVAGVGGALVSSRTVTVAPGAETIVEFSFHATSAGWLEARIDSRDALPLDDRVQLELPAPARLRVAVFSADPAPLKPLLAADPHIEARYLAPSAYKPDFDADLLLLDSFTPADDPRRPSLRLMPGTAEMAVARWSPTHPVATGVRSQDLRLSGARTLMPAADEAIVAESAQGALIVARDAAPRSVRLGFQPMRAQSRFALATPLLIANIFQWMAPDLFLRREIVATPPGAISAELPTATESVRVLDASGAALPFTLDGRTVRFFTADPSTVRVLAPGIELVYSLSLPGLGDHVWRAPETAARGLAARVASAAPPKDIWQALAILGVLLIALEWWLYRARPLSRLSLALKITAIAAALVSLFQPDLRIEESKLAVAVLVDTSGGVPAADLDRASRTVAAIESARGRNEVRVLPFARALRYPTPREMASGWKLLATAGDAGRATSIESALRQAVTVLPAGLVPRIVLISDGRETDGLAARAAWQARQLGIPIDTYAMAGRAAPRLKIESVSLPAVAFSGERFPILATVTSPQPATARLEIAAEGRSLGATEVKLDAGENRLSVRAAIATAGSIDLSLELKAGDLGEVRAEQAINVRRPRLLFVSEDSQAMDAHLLATLLAAQFDVTSNASLALAKIDDYQVVVLNNCDIESIPMARKADLEHFVQRGGGLLVIGGERNVYVDRKQPQLDPLRRTLPATIAPPRSPEGATVVLIIDKSSSMEGRKMELARLAAIGVVENLKPIDQVGVLIFDNSHQWAVPLRRAEDRAMIKRLIAGITPDGGTQIAPALSEAYRRIRTAPGAYKHIVLLTDGISEEGDSATVAKDAAANRVTISTVGLGQDVNRAYLERVAQFAKGKAYFLTDPSGLEQILLKDVMEHTGSTTVERAIGIHVTRPAEILQGLDLERNAPTLKGYVRYQAKPTAETLLTIAGSATGTPPVDDPLLARWQYGLGRAAVFTSDAKSRWAESWVAWPGFDKFWANLMRDVLPHAQSGQAELTYDAPNGELIADYLGSSAAPLPTRLPELFVIGPNGFRKPLKVERLTADHIRARVSLPEPHGMFRVRPLEESVAWPEVGLFLPELEMTTYGSNPELLKQLSAYTGGRFEPTSRQIFEPRGRGIPAAFRLWPLLLAIAVLLNLGEVAWRRLRRARG